MPIYEYRCHDCNKQFEYMQRMSEDAKTECEECGGTLERLISASAFHLKGGGWYKDLYASKKPGADSKSDSGSSSGSDSKSSSDSGSSSSSDGGSSAASGGSTSSSGGGTSSSGAAD